MPQLLLIALSLPPSLSHEIQPQQQQNIQEGGDRDPSKVNITGGVQLLTRDAATGLYGVKEVSMYGYVCVWVVRRLGRWMGFWTPHPSPTPPNSTPLPHTIPNHRHKVFLADGSGLSGVSAAVRLPPFSDDESNERFLLGSWSDTGVLLCGARGKTVGAGGDGGGEGDAGKGEL